MSLSRIIWYYLFVAPHLLQTVLTYIAVRRGLFKRFPAFLLYTTYEAIQFPVSFFVVETYGLSGATYFHVFVVDFVVSAVLRFGIIYEVFKHLLSAYPAVRSSAAVFFRWVFALLLLASVILALSARGEGPSSPLKTLFVADRTVSIVQCGLIVGLFLFSSYLALSWNNRVFGIAFGLGIFTTVQMAATALNVQFPTVDRTTIDLLTMGTYHICVLLWMYYLLGPEKGPGFGRGRVEQGELEGPTQESIAALLRPGRLQSS